MATGIAYGGICYASQNEAIDAYYTQHKAEVIPGSPVGMLVFSKDSGVWKTQILTQTNNLWALQSEQIAPVPTFPECQMAYQSFFDGLELGWMLILLLVTAFGLRQIREQAR